MDFRRLVSEPCIYIKENNSKEITCIIAIYVDDILLAGKSKEIMYIKEQIKMYFNIKDIGDVDFVIGIKFEKCHDGYTIYQKQYIKDLLVKFKLTNSPSIKNLKPTDNYDLRKGTYDESLYGSAIGNLIYLAVCARPNIIFTVNKAARRSKNLKYTIDYSINFTKD